MSTSTPTISRVFVWPEVAPGNNNVVVVSSLVAGAWLSAQSLMPNLLNLKGLTQPINQLVDSRRLLHNCSPNAGVTRMSHRLRCRSLPNRERVARPR